MVKVTGSPRRVATTDGNGTKNEEKFFIVYFSVMNNINLNFQSNYFLFCHLKILLIGIVLIFAIKIFKNTYIFNFFTVTI